MLVKNHSRAQVRCSLYDTSQVLSRAAIQGVESTALVTYLPEAILKSLWIWIDQMHLYICTEFHNFIPVVIF